MKSYIGKITDDRHMSCSRLIGLTGLSHWSTPNDELRKSIDAIDRGTAHAPGNYVLSEAADWGNWHEGNILAVMADRLSLEQPELEVTEPVIHKTLPLQGSLDGRADGASLTFTTDTNAGIYVIGQNEICLDGMGVLEAKSTRHAPEIEPDIGRGPLQVQGLMMCTGYQWAAIGVLYQGSELRIFLYAPDQSQRYKISADVQDFQTRLDLYRTQSVTDWYPALTPNDAALTWPTAEPEQSLTLSTELSDRVSELHAAKRARRAIEDQIAGLTSEIQSEMGCHETAYAQENGENFARVSWRMSRGRKAYAVEAKPPTRAKSLVIKILDD